MKVIKLWLVFWLFISLTVTKCSVNEDCGQGYVCQKIQECDDYGCHPPTFEWIPSDEDSIAYSFSSTSSSTSTGKEESKETKEESHIQKKPNNKQSSSAGSEGSRPSRLIIRTQNSQSSILRFDSATNSDVAYEMAMSPEDGSLRLANTAKEIFKISSDGQEIDCTNNVVLKTFGLEVQNLWKFEQTHLKYNGVPQWKLAHDEVFKVGEHAEGWSLPEATTKCGAIHMLGGYCKTSSETLSKVFNGLPDHTRIRIQANFHFIDSWAGDTAYLKISNDDSK